MGGGGRLRLNPNLAPSQMFLHIFGELDVVKHFKLQWRYKKTKNFSSLLKLVYNKCAAEFVEVFKYEPIFKKKEAKTMLVASKI